MRHAYVYVLHFDVKLSHAQHYIGCTHNVKRRLAAHAMGAGSHLCRVLRDYGITWRLGALGSCNHAGMRRIERMLKNQHNAAQYCTLCKGDEAKRIRGTTPYPIDELDFPTNAVDCCMLPHVRAGGSVRFTGEHEPVQTMDAILDLMNADKDALGFIPAGGQEGLQILCKAGKICVAEAGGEVVGYCAFTVNPEELCVNIQQCVVRDDARLYGFGRRMVKYIETMQECVKLRAKVRDDLVANRFWEAIGFAHVGDFKHKTSGSTINIWEKVKPI